MPRGTPHGRCPVAASRASMGCPTGFDQCTIELRRHQGHGVEPPGLGHAANRASLQHPLVSVAPLSHTLWSVAPSGLCCAALSHPLVCSTLWSLLRRSLAPDSAGTHA
eukprot:352562-Chlamydomonas_euryale.AAC.3